jgi:hypothetical protein
MAAKKAVKELSSKGLLPEEGTSKSKLEGMRQEANNHQTQMEEMVTQLTKSEGLGSSNIEEMAKETEQEATKIMETYLREDPDSQEALEFLCLAEGGEVTHYEVLSEMTKDMRDKQIKTR